MTIVSDSSTPLNTISADAAAVAFRKVISYNVIDIFDLNVEESIWLNSKLAELEEMLSNYEPSSLPLAVTKEVRTKKYSSLLTQRALSQNTRGSSVSTNGKVMPPLSAWTMFFTSPITESYQVPASVMLRIRSILEKILVDLGIGNDKNPRGATKIPVELKLLLR